MKIYKVVAICAVFCILLSLFGGCKVSENVDKPNEDPIQENKDDTGGEKNDTSAYDQTELTYESYTYEHSHEESDYVSIFGVTIAPKIGLMSIYTTWLPEFFGYTEKDGELTAASCDGQIIIVFNRTNESLVFNASKSSGTIPGGLESGLTFTYNEEASSGYNYSGGYYEADVDGDGINENWIIGIGPTSGLYSNRLLCYVNGRLLYHKIIYNHLPILKVENGKLYISVVNPILSTLPDYYEVTITDGKICSEAFTEENTMPE